MEYRNAGLEDLEAVLALVQDTIRRTYPRYYPQGVVDFFLEHHSRDHIQASLEAGQVTVLLEDSGRLVGTGSREGNHITRLYVAPDRQGQGLGGLIMDRLEAEIDGGTAVLDASLPASRFYERRGYRTVRHERLDVQGGAVLVYEVMEKRLRED